MEVAGLLELEHDEYNCYHEIGYKEPIVSEPFIMQGGEVGRDIHVFRDLIENPTEARIDEEAKYLLDFEKKMLKKYGSLFQEAIKCGIM